ncbi:peptide chain release factor N(5)-glutamine methyltransferase [Paraurantiacibacter namhicola]|uniref:Release factor glutamine methyltransferase n=1 Tax=Paraurantiacibacter namhicola TaxID=645517 RepID=A0A1C7D4Z4_9SPHN|nr:peptide chain release factor N(5)-glutamine methyltransferase [Paraurantiacibacter namhicola]ANU06546.1 Release factor glutamine methyltransferase [Paraurantiacibacter namhicola]
MSCDIATALRDAATQLAATSDTARLDAELLMAHALGLTRSDMLLRHMREPAPEGFAALVERRAAHEPIAHITGEQEFYGRSFAVTPDTLVPRGDSECVVDAALEAVPDARSIIDLGTGTGCLLLTLLAERPQATGVGVERSDRARAVAVGNARALGLSGRADMVARDWTRDGWRDGLGRFDLVISNPPYVEAEAALQPDVRDYEPGEALFAGPDGLEDYRLLVPQLPALLLPGGVAVLEIGAAQDVAVTQLAVDAGFAVTLRRDLGGRPRALVLRHGDARPGN